MQVRRVQPGGDWKNATLSCSRWGFSSTRKEQCSPTSCLTAASDTWSTACVRQRHRARPVYTDAHDDGLPDPYQCVRISLAIAS